MDTTQIPLNWAKSFYYSLWLITKLSPDSWKWWFLKNPVTHMTWGLSQASCDSAKFVGSLTASSAGLLDWDSMISSSSLSTKERVQSSREEPGPLSKPLWTQPTFFKRAFSLEDLLTERSPLKIQFCAQDTSNWIRKDNTHKKILWKVTVNAKCQIREVFNRRGEICAGT